MAKDKHKRLETDMMDILSRLSRGICWGPAVLTKLKDVLYSILGPDLLGLTIAVLNVNFSTYCAFLYHTSLKGLLFIKNSFLSIHSPNTLKAFRKWLCHLKVRQVD